MVASNADAIYAEYPFLSKIVCRVKVRDGFVQRWDAAFLRSTPDQYPDSGQEKIYFVDEEGKIVGRVGNPITRLFITSETVGQALARIKEHRLRRVKYAVAVWFDVILWKLPKGYDNAADWISPVIEEARQELQQS